MNQEYWDIYDINKNKSGRRMKKDDWSLQPGDYHLTVLGAVKRGDGKYLITKRKGNKSFAPGWWEIPGGGVMAGEESFGAVLREVKEETGLDVSSCEYELSHSYSRESDDGVNVITGDNYIVDTYTFFYDFDESEVKCQEEETDGFMTATAEQIAELGRQGIFLHYNSIKSVFGF